MSSQIEIKQYVNFIELYTTRTTQRHPRKDKKVENSKADKLLEGGLKAELHFGH